MRRVLFIAALLALAATMPVPARSSQSSAFLPGGSFDRPAAIAVDASDRAFIAVSTQSRDYGQTSRLSPVDAWLPRNQAFVSRIDIDGTQTHWPITEASLDAIAIDAAGFIYVAGARVAPEHGGPDAFVARLRPSGSVEYSVTFGGSADDRATGIALDAAGNIFVVGATSSADFQSSRLDQPCRASIVSGSDAFVVRINPQGAVAESTCLGGTGYDAAVGVALDPKGDLVVAGATRAADFPVTQGALQSRFADNPCVPKVGCGDAFVAKLAPADLKVVWSTYFGGSASDVPEGIALDAAGNAYIVGATRSRDLPLHDPVQAECRTAYAATDCGDAFIAKLDSSGSSLLFGSFIGGEAWETARGVAVSPDGLVSIAGSTSSTNLLGRQFETEWHNTDSFLAVLNRANDVLDVRVMNHGRNERIEGMAASRYGLLYLIGAVDVPVPSDTPCCYSDRDAYVTTIR